MMTRVPARLAPPSSPGRVADGSESATGCRPPSQAAPVYPAILLPRPVGFRPSSDLHHTAARLQHPLPAEEERSPEPGGVHKAADPQPGAVQDRQLVRLSLQGGAGSAPPAPAVRLGCLAWPCEAVAFNLACGLHTQGFRVCLCTARSRHCYMARQPHPLHAGPAAGHSGREGLCNKVVYNPLFAMSLSSGLPAGGLCSGSTGSSLCSQPCSALAWAATHPSRRAGLRALAASCRRHQVCSVARGASAGSMRAGGTQ